MPQATDAVWLDVLPSMRNFGSELEKGAASEAEKAGKSTGARFGKAMLAGMALIGGGAALATKAIYSIGETFDNVADTIRTGTGATGAALDDLTQSAKNIGSTVPAEFSDIGTAVADLNTRLGLTGAPLEEMSAQFLNLSRITGTDLQSNIANMTRVFGDWDVAADEQAGTMDKLFRAAQASGISIDRLSQQVVQFGSPLRAMGFSLDEATAIFAKFEKEGVNAELVIGALRQGLGKMAKAGEDAPATFRRVVEEIAGMESRTEATAAAMELFGARAGPDMAAAIQEGRFELDEMLSVIEGGSDTINGAADDTADFAEKWQVFKNRVLIAVEPLATRLFNALGDGMDRVSVAAPLAFDYFQANVLPTLRTLGSYMKSTVVPVLKDFGEFLLDPVIPGMEGFGGWIVRNRSWLLPLAAAVTGVVVALKVWNATLAAYRAIQIAVTAVTAAWNLVLAANPIGLVVLALAGLVAALVTAYHTSETFRNVVDRTWRGVRVAVESVTNWITGTAFPALTGGIDKVKSAFSTGVAAIGSAWEKLKSVAMAPVRFVIETVLNNGLIKAFNWIADKVPGVGKIDTIPVPSMPRGVWTGAAYASGGIYPGYTPGKDIGYAAVSGGEAIMRPEWTRAVGADRVHAMNAAARRGGVEGVRRFMGAFQSGGVVDRFKEGLNKLGNVGQGAFDWTREFVVGNLRKAAEKLLEPIFDQLSGVGGGIVGDLAKGLANKAKSVLLGIAGDHDRQAEVAGGSFAATTGGLNPQFLAQFRAYNAAIGNVLRITSGYRSPEHQERIFRSRYTTVGPTRLDRRGVNWNGQRWYRHSGAVTAPPGRSNHQRGLAIDHDPWSTAAMRGVAARFGLRYPMSYEPWHVEPASVRKYDRGGHLMPGVTMAINNTGRPERVLTGPQEAAIARALEGRTAAGPSVHMQNVWTTDPRDLAREVDVQLQLAALR